LKRVTLAGNAWLNMPELPEVETMCRGVLPIVGGRIERVVDPRCAYRPIRCEPDLEAIDRQLRGAVVQRISRLGKRVVIETERWALILQPKMTGLVAIDEVPDPEHVRLELRLSGARVERLQFWDRRGLGTVQLLPRERLEQEIVEGRLGPDALVISQADFTQRLQATRRPIKVALLDQKQVAGIGNLYASEMLHAASIDPRAAAADVSAKKLARLYAEMQRILQEAIAHEGSTLSDGTYRNALNQSGGYQNQHQVYDRAGESCPRCRRTAIERIVQAQRSTFFCPRCQRAAR
jgi:formamidopyrimidine-DNA glycosylase